MDSLRCFALKTSWKLLKPPENPSRTWFTNLVPNLTVVLLRAIRDTGSQIQHMEPTRRNEWEPPIALDTGIMARQTDGLKPFLRTLERDLDCLQRYAYPCPRFQNKY